MEEELKKAFDNPKFTWRTIPGIAKETGIDAKKVSRYINLHSDDMVNPMEQQAIDVPEDV